MAAWCAACCLPGGTSAVPWAGQGAAAPLLCIWVSLRWHLLSPNSPSADDAAGGTERGTSGAVLQGMVVSCHVALTFSVFHIFTDWPFLLFFFFFSRLQTRKQWNKWPKYTVSYVGEGKFILNLWEIEVCYLVPPIKIIKRTESDIKSIHFHDKAHYEQRKYSPILTCSHYCSKIYHVKCNVQGRKGKHSLPLP